MKKKIVIVSGDRFNLYSIVNVIVIYALFFSSLRIMKIHPESSGINGSGFYYNVVGVFMLLAYVLLAPYFASLYMVIKEGKIDLVNLILVLPIAYAILSATFAAMLVLAS